MNRQLDFFKEEKSDLDYLREDFQEMKKTNDKVRKSMYARNGNVERLLAELEKRLQIIERNICRQEFKLE